MGLNFRHLAVSPDVLSQTVANEAVLLDLRSEKYFGLNSVGLRIWELLQQTDDVAAIRDQLLNEFDVPPATLEQDLNDVLVRLLAAGLVQEPSA